MRELALIDPPFPNSDAFAMWQASRRPLVAEFGEDQIYPWAILIYGDDPKFLCVSTKWYIRALRCWDTVVSRYHIELAPPHKIFNGAWDKWCGLLHIHALGIMMIPMNKRKCAQAPSLNWSSIANVRPSSAS